MIEVTTVSGKIHKFDGYNWEVKTDGLLIVKIGPETLPLKTVFASGQWESIKEFGK